MDTLRYRPARGQDAAPLVAALRGAGYDAAPETSRGQQVVVISAGTDGQLDREQVRAVLQEHNQTSVFDGGQVTGGVRFEGEG